MTVTETRRRTSRRDTYVGGLDGLRAIAVAAVIVFHFAPSVLPAGFLGVDVFFVVSGFLIARLVDARDRAVGHGVAAATSGPGAPAGCCPRSAR